MLHVIFWLPVPFWSKEKDLKVNLKIYEIKSSKSKFSLPEIRCTEHAGGNIGGFDYWSEALIFDDINALFVIIDINDFAVINIP